MLWEMLTGLFMILTVTSTISISLGETEGGVRIMLIAALGCNIAWGLVDGALCVVAKVMDRGRYSRLIEFSKSAADPGKVEAAVEKELDPVIIGLLDEDKKKEIYEKVVDGIISSKPKEVGILKSDFLSGLAYLLLMIVSGFPVTLPFFFVKNLAIAVRVSNVAAMLMLFGAGYEWGRQTGRNKLVTGLVMVLLGLIIVAVTVALGG